MDGQCKECGFSAGFLNLKNGKCKSCINKKSTSTHSEMENESLKNMDTQKIWGMILIVAGVAVGLYGVKDLYDAIQYGNQISNAIGGMSSMMGDFGIDIGSIAAQAGHSKTPGVLAIIFGAVSAIVGTKLLKNVS